MYNKCQRIVDFYERFAKDEKYVDMISHQTTGPFGGQRISYTFPTNIGTVKVKCDCGINTLRIFHPLEILLVGSVKGTFTDSGGTIGSEGSKWAAIDISDVSQSGECSVKTLFSSGTIKLPVPLKKQ